MQRIVSSAEEMQLLAREVAKDLRGGEALLLYGELGAGKTTFVQGLARVLGVRENVTSPTFNLVLEYSIQMGKIKTFIHADLYRLEKRQVEKDMAVQDVLERAGEEGRVTAIEWADRLPDEFFPNEKRIYFEHGKTAEERIVRIGTRK